MLLTRELWKREIPGENFNNRFVYLAEIIRGKMTKEIGYFSNFKENLNQREVL